MARFEDTLTKGIKRGRHEPPRTHRPDTLNTLTSEERGLKPFHYTTKGRIIKDYET